MADAPDPDVPDGEPPRQRFRLYCTGERIYCVNPDHKLVDLGGLTARQGAGVRWELDGTHATGDAADAAEALRQIAQRLEFFWLDGQFTALADLRDEVNLEGAEQLDLVLRLPQPGEHPSALG
ncbi:hypothetical protein WG922_19960 [Ramlibacter sp. AN1015]|uniref:hypothetical protein n=1 Tax=Ramlibacter sp. AN1015 TaxID=3133428 RepID=UPI0030BC41BA